MSHTFNFGKIAKKKNSTLRPSLGASYDVLFKSPTSIYQPTITLNADSFNYNYAKWGDLYYFVKDTVAKNNNLYDVTLELDPMATAKSEILATTQYVSYSNAGSLKLADTRIPVLKDASGAMQYNSISVFDSAGCYILSVVGRNGCRSYVVSQATLTLLIHDLQTWVDDENNTIKGNLTDSFTGLGEALIDSGAVGNTYNLAPQCIRSCIWVPFSANFFGGADATIWLGNYECKSGGSPLTGKLLAHSLYKDSFTVNIPWHYTDWRRSYCEDVYLYLPLVGMVGLSSDSLIDSASLLVKYAVTPNDGAVVYEVLAGTQVIGTYGGNCSAQIPIGINQASSAGANINSVVGGIGKTVASMIGGAAAGFKATGEMLGVGAGMIGGAILGASAGVYGIANTAYSTNLSTIGGIGGGAGGGLDLDAICYTVYHNTVVEPSAMAATMGLPTMKPVQLSSLSGYCQCANAHAAVSLPSEYISIIDAYLNSGFYIE